MKQYNFLDSLQLRKDSYNHGIRTISSNFTTQTSCSIANYETESKEPFWKCRYVVVLLGLASFTVLNGHRLNMSITLIAMLNNTALIEKATVKSQSCLNLLSNDTTEEYFPGVKTQEGEFAWSPKIQGFILSSLFFGYLGTQFPAGILVERFGSKKFIFLASFITGICTLMIPALSRFSVWALIAVNVVRGIAQGSLHPSFSVLTANWFPKMERGLLYTTVLSGCPLGSFFTSVFSGLLCEYGGWPSSFYTFGFFYMVLSMFIMFFLYENPNVHPSISKAERDFILSNQEITLSRIKSNVPWRKIFTSVPFYAMSLGCFGQLWALTQFLAVHATYLATVLHYPIIQNGIFSALPFLLQYFTAQTAAFLSMYLQKKSIASVGSLRKLNTLFSCAGCSGCLFGIYLAGCNRNLSVFFGIIAMGFIGTGYAGCWIASVDMSPQFAGSVNAVCLTITSFSCVILTLIVGYLTDEMQTIEQWNKVMFISIGVVLTTGIIFTLFGSAEVQPWNFVEGTAEEPKNVDKTKDKDGKNNYEVTRF